MLVQDQTLLSFSPDDVPRSIVGLGFSTALSAMDELIDHHHRKAQLFLTLGGIVTCEMECRVWIVPPHCAVWIPGGTPHRIKGSGDVRVCCILIDSRAAFPMPDRGCTVAVSPLLRELLQRASLFPEMYDEDGKEGRLANVLLDELAEAPVANLSFPMPGDPKLRKIADAMMADPAERLTIVEWGRRTGIAERTLSRLLRKETGMSFVRWRQQLHILIALQRLTDGVPVQIVAQDLGYEGASAFITMFRKILGKSPLRYLADRTG